MDLSQNEQKDPGNVVLKLYCVSISLERHIKKETAMSCAKDNMSGAASSLGSEKLIWNSITSISFVSTDAS